MKKLIKLIFLMNFFSVAMFHVNGETTKSISQMGVTFLFDTPVNYGQFVTGEYWISDAGEGVTINSIIPSWDGLENGAEVNPNVDEYQGFRYTTSNAYGWNEELNMNFPYVASGNESVVKTIGGTGTSKPYIQTAVVLTVLSDVPEDGLRGGNTFRPPYVGTYKPIFEVSDVDWDALPSLNKTGLVDVPSLSSLENAWDPTIVGLRLDHHTKAPRMFRSKNGFGGGDGYMPDYTSEIFDIMCRLMLDDSQEAKKDAMVFFLQSCIDRLYILKGGYRQGSRGGHNPMHRIQAGFAAKFLNISTGFTFLQNATNFHEDSFIYIGEGSNIPLWGQHNSETAYWDNQADFNSGNKSNRDPYGFIDGGHIKTNSYQHLTAKSIKYQVLVAELIPGLQLSYSIENSSTQTSWNTIKGYAERMTNHGRWASPDPYAPYDSVDSNRGLTWGEDPENGGDGIHGNGRYLGRHGGSKDEGHDASSFVESVWAVYYPNKVINSKLPNAPFDLTVIDK